MSRNQLHVNNANERILKMFKFRKANEYESEQMCGGSWSGFNLVTTPQRLSELFGEATFSELSEDYKVSLEYHMVVDDEAGGVRSYFSIYDWKEYDRPANDPKNVGIEYEFHLGGGMYEEVWVALKELVEGVCV